MTKRERLLRIKYASTLLEFSQEKIFTLLQEVEGFISRTNDEAEKERLQRRFDQIKNTIDFIGLEIDSLTSEKRIAKPRFRVIKRGV